MRSGNYCVACDRKRPRFVAKKWWAYVYCTANFLVGGLDIAPRKANAVSPFHPCGFKWTPSSGQR